MNEIFILGGARTPMADYTGKLKDFSALELGATLQIAVSHDIFFELGGQGLVPFKRQEFLTRRQDEPVWSQPWFSGGALLGVGARFP